MAGAMVVVVVMVTVLMVVVGCGGECHNLALQL